MASKQRNSSEDRKLSAVITVICDPELKDLAWRAADAAGLPLSEFCAQMIAKAMDRPDLSKVPRKPMGRPRKVVVLNGK